MDNYKKFEAQDRTEFKAYADSESFLRNTDTRARNSMVPSSPKPGEVMVCQVCNKPMMPKDFSKDERTRRREFKWHMHQSCMLQMEDLVDRSTPGLMSERKKI